jgi:hypothetical protein
MNDHAEPTAAGTALVLCKEAQTRRLIGESLRALAIRPEICEDLLTAIGLLNKQKFEAVIVDLLLGEEATLVMQQLRFSRANRTAVTFAITTEDGEQTPVVRLNSTFVLQRPLSAASVNQTLRAAYGMVVRERRRYFRCPVAVPAFVRARQPEEILCQTVNISEGGIALSAPSTLDPTLAAAVRLRLPDRSSQLCAEARVCWRNENGLVGFEFQSLASDQKAELQEWLARKLDETLPNSVADLFRAVGES